MNEQSLINKITSIVGAEHIGDDCAFLEELGIVVTQDSLVEDVHFTKEIATPYQLGYKSAMVNLSDIAASGAKPCYMTVSISIPKIYDEDFVEEFYKGCTNVIEKYNVKIIGGDITSSDKLYISICAIGKTENRKISSRKNAKIGHKIITSGVHGSSATGLKILLEDLNPDTDLIKAHLMPKAQIEFSERIATQITEDYAMMDSSDGLFDALFKIGEASNCTMSIDLNKIPYDAKIKEYSDNYKELIFYGGEDYQLIATVPDEFLRNNSDYTVIGEVIPKEDCVIKVCETLKINNISDKIFNHFN